MHPWDHPCQLLGESMGVKGLKGGLKKPFLTKIVFKTFFSKIRVFQKLTTKNVAYVLDLMSDVTICSNNRIKYGVMNNLFY